MHLKAKKRFGRTSLARASGVRPLAFSHTATGPSCAAGQLSDADSTMFGVLDSKIRSRRQFSSNTPVTLKVRDHKHNCSHFYLSIWLDTGRYIFDVIFIEASWELVIRVKVKVRI